VERPIQLKIMGCQRCGNCCIKASFLWNSDDTEKEDIANWFFYHRCDVTKNQNGGFNISVPLVCVNLENTDGVYSCKIYDTRPSICKKFLCKKAKEETI